MKRSTLVKIRLIGVGLFTTLLSIFVGWATTEFINFYGPEKLFIFALMGFVVLAGMIIFGMMIEITFGVE